MLTYANVPANYKERHDLGGLLSDIILDRKVPEPGQISGVFGREAVKPYFLMHALSHHREYGKRERVIGYGRRDQRAMQIHPYDSALKPFFRLKDSRIPSGHDLTLREIIGLLVHDLGEEFGKSLVGAYIVNDVVGELLGEDAKKDANLLTNNNGLLLDSLKNDISRYNEVDEKKLINILERKKDNLKVNDERILYEYQRSYNAMDTFRRYVERNADYMVEEEKEGLLKIMDEMLIDLNTKIMNRSFLGSVDLEGLIIDRHDHVINILNVGDYKKVDPNLVDSNDQKFLLDVDKTLYWDYIKELAVLAKAGLIEPLREKLADVNDYVSNMNYDPIEHATRIFRKARILISFGFEVGTCLKQNEGEYKPIQKSVDYLFRNLYHKVDSHFKYLRKETLTETKYKNNFENFQIMREKLRDSKKELSSKRSGVDIVLDIMSDIFNVRPPKLSVVYF